MLGTDLETVPEKTEVDSSMKSEGIKLESNESKDSFNMYPRNETELDWIVLEKAASLPSKYNFPNPSSTLKQPAHISGFEASNHISHNDNESAEMTRLEKWAKHNQPQELRHLPKEGIVVEIGLPEFVSKFRLNMKEEFSTFSDDKLYKELSSMLRKYKQNGTYSYKT